MLHQSKPVSSVAAALTLLVNMGFGRFAFTGLYPLMVNEHHLSVEGGSLAASANYAGYLAGALLAGTLLWLSSRRVTILATIATILGLEALSLPLTDWLIITVRGLAGVASAVGMVAGAHWLIHDRDYAPGAPTLFAGVGAGILVSAEMIVVASAVGLGSDITWLVLAASALVVTLAASILMNLPTSSDRILRNPADIARHGKQEPLNARVLIAIYGLAGIGYIITATYLPLLVQGALGSVNPAHVWAMFGLGAIPSCFLWHRVHVRLGTSGSPHLIRQVDCRI
jgi:hypothetical protein